MFLGGIGSSSEYKKDVKLEVIEAHADETETVALPLYQLKVTIPVGLTASWYGSPPLDIMISYDSAWVRAPLSIKPFKISQYKDLEATIQSFKIQDSHFRVLESHESPGENDFDFLYLDHNSKGEQQVGLFSSSRIDGKLYTCRSIAIATEISTHEMRDWQKACRTLSGHVPAAAPVEPKVAQRP